MRCNHRFTSWPMCVTTPSRGRPKRVIAILIIGSRWIISSLSLIDTLFLSLFSVTYALAACAARDRSRGNCDPRAPKNRRRQTRRRSVDGFSRSHGGNYVNSDNRDPARTPFAWATSFVISVPSIFTCIAIIPNAALPSRIRISDSPQITKTAVTDRSRPQPGAKCATLNATENQSLLSSLFAGST